MTAPKAITFDCYGTLVEWGAGLHKTLGSILACKASGKDVDDFVDRFHQIRHGETGRSYRPYKTILSVALEKALAEFGLRCEAADRDRLIEGVRAIGPFPEVPAALLALRKHARIAIISNSDRDLIVHNVKNIGVPIDYVFVAEDARAYKPSLDLFRHMLRGIGCDPTDVVHVGASMSLDMMPAANLGMRRVWINRLGEHGDPRWQPYVTLRDLAGLPAIIEGLAEL